MNRYVFYLLSGVQSQSEALMKLAATQHRAEAARFLVVYKDEKGIEPAIDEVAQQAEALGWMRPRTMDVKDFSDWSSQLGDKKIDAVLWLTSGVDLQFAEGRQRSDAGENR